MFVPELCTQTTLRSWVLADGILDCPSGVSRQIARSHMHVATGLLYEEKDDDMDKFILTDDLGTAMLLKDEGFSVVGQDGKCWYFLNDEERLKINKTFFEKKKVKYTTTNKLLFNDFYGVQYIKN